MRRNDELQKEMAGVREKMLAVAAKHENEAHGGRVCVGERCNIIAYLAHAFLLDVQHLPVVSELLNDYIEGCEDCKARGVKPSGVMLVATEEVLRLPEEIKAALHDLAEQMVGGKPASVATSSETKKRDIN